VINALRQGVDKRHGGSFWKFGEAEAVRFPSRHYDFKRQKWVFGKASDDEICYVCGEEGLLGTELSTEYLVPSNRECHGGGGDGAAEKQVFLTAVRPGFPLRLKTMQTNSFRAGQAAPQRSH